jgi:hypothetical protein
MANEIRGLAAYVKSPAFKALSPKERAALLQALAQNEGWAGVGEALDYLEAERIIAWDVNGEVIPFNERP